MRGRTCRSRGSRNGGRLQAGACGVVLGQTDPSGPAELRSQARCLALESTVAGRAQGWNQETWGQVPIHRGVLAATSQVGRLCLSEPLTAGEKAGRAPSVSAGGHSGLVFPGQQRPFAPVDTLRGGVWPCPSGHPLPATPPHIGPRPARPELGHPWEPPQMGPPQK